jgi:hypothetical protein
VQAANVNHPLLHLVPSAAGQLKLEERYKGVTALQRLRALAAAARLDIGSGPLPPPPLVCMRLYTCMHGGRSGWSVIWVLAFGHTCLLCTARRTCRSCRSRRSRRSRRSCSLLITAAPQRSPRAPPGAGSTMAADEQMEKPVSSRQASLPVAQPQPTSHPPLPPHARNASQVHTLGTPWADPS